MLSPQSFEDINYHLLSFVPLTTAEKLRVSQLNGHLAVNITCSASRKMSARYITLKAGVRSKSTVDNAAKKSGGTF